MIYDIQQSTRIIHAFLAICSAENDFPDEETSLTDKQLYTLVVYNGVDPTKIPPSFTTVSARQQYYESMKLVAANRTGVRRTNGRSIKVVLTIGTWWPFLEYARKKGWVTAQYAEEDFWLASDAQPLYAKIQGEQRLHPSYREAMILGYMMGGFEDVFNTEKIPNQAFAKTFCDNFAASVFRPDPEQEEAIPPTHFSPNVQQALGQPQNVSQDEEDESHDNDDDHSESDDNRDDVVIISETPGNGIFIKEEPVYEEEPTEQVTQKRTQPVPTVTPEKKQKRSRRATVKKA